MSIAPPTVPTVRDRRSEYFHGQTVSSPVNLAPYTPRNYRNNNTNQQVMPSAGVLGGIRIRAGAAAVTVIAYDATTDGQMTGDNVIDHCVTSTWDGDFTPIQVQRGIRISIAGADLNTDVTVFYRTAE